MNPSGGGGWIDAWDVPRRLAGVGGLCLEWLSWHPAGEAPAADALIAQLHELAASAPRHPCVWAGVAPMAHSAGAAIGIRCERAWPRACGRYVYAAARLQVPAVTSVGLRLGTYIGYRAWLDGHLVLRCADGTVFALDDNLRLLGLEAGVHTLVVEVDRDRWETVFHARVACPDGSDLPDGALRIARAGLLRSTPIPSADDHYADLINAPGRLELARYDASRATEWRAAFGDVYRRLLNLPRAPRTSVVEGPTTWQDLRRERVVLHGGPAGPVPMWCLWPTEAEAGRRVPAVLCIHGHGAGKDDVIGVAGPEPGGEERIAQHHDAYGLALARMGFAVFAPDLSNFGERTAATPRDGRTRDACDNNFMKAVMLGRLPLAHDLADLVAVIDYAESRPEVDRERIGCAGLSLGGRMAMYLAALDSRIAVTASSGALNMLRERLTSFASCGAQLLPGLWTYGDTPEVFGLIAPRPLVLELGTQDGTSPEVFAAEAFRLARRAYAWVGAQDRLQSDIFARGHRWSGRLALAAFDRWLRDAPRDRDTAAG